MATDNKKTVQSDETQNRIQKKHHEHLIDGTPLQDFIFHQENHD